MKPLKLTLLAALAVLLSSCFFFPEEEPLLPPPVIKQDDVTYVTYAAKRADIVSRSTASGYVVSANEDDCFFTAYTGNIKAVYPRPGELVSEGDLIAELDCGELDFETETARLTAELARLDYAASPTETRKLEYELAQNAYEQLRTRLDGARIYAPRSGRVTFVERLNPGEEVNPYRVLVRIADPNSICASAMLNDTNRSSFKEGGEVEITVGGSVYPGEIASITDDKVTAEFTDSAPDFSKMGSFADITVIKGRSLNAVVIPRSLIKNLGGKTYVQILDDDGSKKDVEVVTGIMNAAEIEIVSGLDEGQQVVVK